MKPGFICEPLAARRRRESGSTTAAPGSGPARCAGSCPIGTSGIRHFGQLIDLVAFADRREAVVAVGDDLRHRQRLRPLLCRAPRSARRAPSFAPHRPASGRGRCRRPALVDRSSTCSASSCSPGVRSRFGLRDRLLHVLGESLVCVQPQLLAVRRFDLSRSALSTTPERASISCVFFAVGLGFRAAAPADTSVST